MHRIFLEAETLSQPDFSPLDASSKGTALAASDLILN